MTVTKENIPQPDPSALTTAQMEKAIAALKDYFEARIHCMEENIDHHDDRLDEISGEEIKAAVDHLEKLHGEKFSGVDQRFKGIEAQTNKVAELQQKALEAALVGAKELVTVQNIGRTEAIAKSEAGFNKQIEGIVTAAMQNAKVTDGKFDDIKDIMNKQESRITSAEGTKSGGKEAWGVMVVVVTLLLAAIGIIVTIVLTRK